MTMADTVDIRPAHRSIAGYGGDTLTIHVTVPAGVVDGYQWNGQVRSARGPDGVIDAQFLITPPQSPGEAAVVWLTAATTRALADKGTLVKRKGPDGSARYTLVYTGDYDIQVKPPDEDDPTITVLQGYLSIDMDVTRVAP